MRGLCVGSIVAMCALLAGADAPAAAGNFISSWKARPEPVLPESPDVALSCPRTKAPPKIDGKLDDACWRNAGEARDFVLYGSGLPPSQQTKTLVTFDDGHLYLAYVCSEAAMAKIQAGARAELREGENDSVWKNDCIELFLDPHLTRDECYQFEVDSLAQKWDARILVPWGRGKEFPEWDSHFRVAATRSETSWTVEMAIAAASMGVDKIRDGSLWGVNFTRNEHPHKEISSWTPWKRNINFCHARHFRSLVLGRATCALGEVNLGPRAHGSNRLHAEVKGDRELRMELDVISSSGRKRSFSREVKANRRAGDPVALEYRLPERKGKVDLVLWLKDARKGTVLAKRRYSLEISTPLIRLKLASPTVYLSAKELKAELTLDLGDVSREKGKVVVELRQGGKVLRRGVQGTSLGRENEVRLNIAGIKQRAYTVRVRALDAKGRELAGAESKLSAVDDPFDW